MTSARPRPEEPAAGDDVSVQVESQKKATENNDNKPTGTKSDASFSGEKAWAMRDYLRSQYGR